MRSMIRHGSTKASAELTLSLTNTRLTGALKDFRRTSSAQWRTSIPKPITRRFLSSELALRSLDRCQSRCYNQRPWSKPKHSLIPYSVPRSIATKPLPQHRGPIFRFIYRFFAYAGGFVLVSGGLVIAFFAYDASTYRDDLSFTDIPVSEHALKPRRGGPKNLPIAEVLVDDDDRPENSRAKDKPKLVILGSGWGSVAMLKALNPEDYHVTVVSPVNYFLFTPMLPSATVGTLELRSLVEPIRRIIRRASGHFLKAEAVDVELSEKLLEVAQTNSKGEVSRFYLPYDKLVLAVGEDFPYHRSIQANMTFRRYYQSSRGQRPGKLPFFERH